MQLGRLLALPQSGAIEKHLRAQRRASTTPSQDSSTSTSGDPRAFSYCGEPMTLDSRRFTPGAVLLYGRRHLTLRLPADSLPRSETISYSTVWPSLRVLKPAFSTAEM